MTPEAQAAKEIAELAQRILALAPIAGLTVGITIKNADARIKLESASAHSEAEALAVLDTVGLPAIIRSSFTVGGFVGFAYTREEFLDIVRRGLGASPITEVLIEGRG